MAGALAGDAPKPKPAKGSKLISCAGAAAGLLGMDAGALPRLSWSKAEVSPAAAAAGACAGAGAGAGVGAGGAAAL